MSQDDWNKGFITGVVAGVSMGPKGNMYLIYQFFEDFIVLKNYLISTPTDDLTVTPQDPTPVSLSDSILFSAYSLSAPTDNVTVTLT